MEPDKTHENETTLCYVFPPKVNSNGVWGYFSPTQDPMLSYALPLLQLQLVLVISTTEACHFVLKRVGIPKFVSQMLSGIILGPQCIGKIQGFRKVFFPLVGQPILELSGWFGYMLMLFVAGVKTDLGMVRTAGREATYIGISSIIVPTVIGMATLAFLNKGMHLTNQERFSLVPLASALSTTTFPVVATLLHDLKIINSELGRLALSSAVIADLLTIGSSYVIISQHERRYSSFWDSGTKVLCMIAFILVMVYLLRPVMFWMIRNTPEGKPIKRVYIYAIFVVMLVSGCLMNQLDEFVFMGPLLLGLAIPNGPPLGSALVEKLDSFVSAILMPVFSSSIFWPIQVYGTSNLTPAAPNPNARVITITLAVVSFATKIATNLFLTWITKMPLVDSLIIGLIMCCRGFIDTGTYAVMRDNQLIPKEMFSVLVLYALVSGAGVAILVTLLYDPTRKYSSYKRRNIRTTKKDTELRMVTCIHRQSDVPPTISLLNMFNPTPENRVDISALHLIELVGSASPMFICHELHKETSVGHSYSRNFILAFREYERSKREFVKVNTFTAISPPLLMHEDIRSLALDKEASFIVLPFHKRWAMDGVTVMDDNKTMRALNCHVVERAPCSVGILINHGFVVERSEQSYDVCLIFIGGNDDREALALARRMVTDARVRLTVLRLVASAQAQAGVQLEWDVMLDAEELKELRHGSNVGEIMYEEREVADGSVTAALVASLLDYYHLIIVGRRHGIPSPQTSGLAQICEFRELGPIGDILASRELNSGTSVLVIQQQQPLTSATMV